MTLTELKALAEKATPGPWEVQEATFGEKSPSVFTAEGPHAGTFVCKTNTAMDGTSEKDAAFIAAAREAMPALIDDLIAAREALERVLKNGLCTDGRVVLWQGNVAELRAVLAAQKVPL